jgi:hypothetical protein
MINEAPGAAAASIEAAGAWADWLQHACQKVAALTSDVPLLNNR